MNMKVLHVGIASAVLVSVVGCSAVGLGTQRIDYRAGAEQVPSIEVPPDLTVPETDDRYKVAGGEGVAVATYSDYNHNAAGAGSHRATASAVLPTVKGVSLQRSGAQRWLLVQDSPENVWPVVKTFLRETGLNIKREDAAAGIIVTEWAENRASIPQGVVREMIGKVFDGMYSSNQLDQYRVRMERSKDGAGTEVYITHRGKEEMMDADGSSSKWQTRESDPELEAEMLQRLMVRFGGTPSQTAIAVAGATAPGGEPVAGGAAAIAAEDTSGPSTGTASLLEIFDGSRIIVINDPFDKSWRRVGLAIDRAGLSVEDKDREKGIYYLSAEKKEKGWLESLEFWNDDESSLRFRVNVKDAGHACEVSVTDQNGVAIEGSKQRIEAIYKNINQ
ncbi:MAG: outer membrane protein assembly factor BamC [Gallionella sp.]|nr:outer membrane protein assembly factor BamC [Gallionella sp.]